MSEQRQPFRFRFPWIPPPAAVSTPAPPRPAGPQTTPAPTLQRPPFRPAGVALAPPPAQPLARAAAPPPPAQTPARPAASPPQPPVRAVEPPAQQPPARAVEPPSEPPARAVEPPPQPPTRAAEPPPARPPARAAEPIPPAQPPARAESSIPSPTRVTARERAASPPPSPSKVALPSQPAPEPRSPLRVAAQPARPRTSPPSPSQTAFKEQPKAEPTSPKQVIKKEQSPQPSREPPRREAAPPRELVVEPEPKQIKSEARQPQPQEPPVVKPMTYEEPKQKPDITSPREVFDRKEVLPAIGHPKPSKPSQKPAMVNGEKTPLHKEIKDDVSKLVQKLGVGPAKVTLDDKPLSIITLAGENRGASMHLGHESAKREGSVHIHRGYKSNLDERIESTTDAEDKGYAQRKAGDQEIATKAYVNNNVQGINNSIMFHSHVSEGNPGVHMVVSRKPVEPVKPQKERKGLEARKSEITSIPSEKFAYAPTVRRRCLRGLFMESSGSDPESSEKPQRHGCWVGYDGKSKENNIDVL